MKRIQKIVRCRDNELDSVIEKHEAEGYLVSGLTWQECNVQYVIVFRLSRNKIKQNKKSTLEDFKREMEKAIEDIKKNPYTPPTKSPWEPYIDPGPGPLRAPYQEPWRMPQIIYCDSTKASYCDNTRSYFNETKTNRYYTTHTYPKHSSKTNGVCTC